MFRGVLYKTADQNMTREKIQYHPLRCSDIQVSKFPSSTDRNRKKKRKQNWRNTKVMQCWKKCIFRGIDIRASGYEKVYLGLVVIQLNASVFNAYRTEPDFRMMCCALCLLVPGVSQHTMSARRACTVAFNISIKIYTWVCW
jgi:hypothetical protein